MKFIMSMGADQMAWITNNLEYHPYRYNKNDFSLHFTTLYLLFSFKCMRYSLVREHDHFNHTKRN